MHPTVSIVLPTFNRASFLAQAFESIRGQTWEDWELIVVDDGSTDDTRQIVQRLARETRQAVRYTYGENGGAAVARNAGVELARGRYLAFFDSDDQWLPHHLAECVAGLEANEDVDWVYGAGRRIDHDTGQVLVEHSFYPDGKARPFLRLRARAVGDLRIIEDKNAALCHIRHGLYCGFQTSVLRRRVFDALRIPPLRVVEDQVFALMALAQGYRLGYFDRIHIVYHVHEANVSAAGKNVPLEKQLAVQQYVTRGLEQTDRYVQLGFRERRAMRANLSHVYFWHLGYVLLWQHGRRAEALQAMRRGLRHWPWDWRCWKTYLLAWVRKMVGRQPLINAD